jgi:serine/threonine-protein kinase RsbW
MDRRKEGKRRVGRRGHAPEQVIELRIPSRLGWERAAMDLAGGVARRMGFPPDRVEDIRTAVSEATINAIEHGNALDASRPVHIVLTPGATRLAIDVCDSGTQPVPGGAEAAMPDLAAKLAERESTRGWGTFLIKWLVDEVEIRSTADANVVRLIMHLGPPGGA